MSLGEGNNAKINVAICHFIARSLNTWRPYSSCTESRPLKYTRYISNRKVFAYIAELLWVAELSLKYLRSVCGKGKQRRRGDVGRWGAVRWTTAIVFMMLRTVWTPRKDKYVFGHLTLPTTMAGIGSPPSLTSASESPFASLFKPLLKQRNSCRKL